MACYDDADFISEYLRHAVVSCDEYASLIFDVPMADEDDNNDRDEDDVEVTTVNRSEPVNPRMKRTRRTARERQMGLNILEDYIHESKAVEESSSFMTAVPAGDSFNRDTITDFSGVDSPLFARDVGNRFNSRRAINGRNSKLHFEIFNRRQSAKPLAHGGTGTGDGNKRSEVAPVPEKNKIITWSDGDVLFDQERVSTLLTAKEWKAPETSKDEKEGEPKQDLGSSSKEKKTSAFINAIDSASQAPRNPFVDFSKHATAKPFCLDGSRVQNEFSICICLDEGLSKDQLQHPIKVRFERSCKVYDVMGLALWMYQVAVDQGNEDDNPKLPSTLVSDYELKTMDDEDEEEEDDLDLLIFIDPNTEAIKYNWALYILKPKSGIKDKPVTDIPTQSIDINLHMVGHAVTKTIRLSDRKTSLQFLFDEGMRSFFNGRPNYGAPYALVPYNQQDGDELDLSKSIEDINCRSFLLRRTKCKPASSLSSTAPLWIADDPLIKISCSLVNASSALKKKGAKFIIACSRDLISLDQIAGSSSSSRSTTNRLASWDLDQVVDHSINSEEGVIKLLVYFKPCNIHTKLLPNALQDGVLSHTNIRSVIIKAEKEDTSKTLLDQFRSYLPEDEDRFEETSPYQKLWDIQSDQNRLRVLNRPLPF